MSDPSAYRPCSPAWAPRSSPPTRGHIAESQGWTKTGAHRLATQIRYPEIVDGDVFDANVSYRICDMSDIPEDLNGFDFNWSSCCFEHLGSLEAGMDFVINAVEKTLRPGGIAVHTTEFNLSSNEQTVEEGPTVIYRRRDIEELVRRFRSRTLGEGLRGCARRASLGLPRRHAPIHQQSPPQTAARVLRLHLRRHSRTSRSLLPNFVALNADNVLTATKFSGDRPLMLVLARNSSSGQSAGSL